MPSRTSFAVIMAAGLLLVAACSDSGQYVGTPSSEKSMPSQDQYAELSRRPSIDEAVAHYDRLRHALQARLSAELGVTGWVDKQDGRQSGCANDFPGVDSRDAVRMFLSFLIAPKPVTGEQWPAATRIVTEVGAAHGFDKPGLQVSKPPAFEFELKDQYQASVTLSTDKTTVISIETGCHLTTAAKQSAGGAPASGTMRG
ncbi:LppA family lipoprotein [Amycolatopsis keratiniphila]|uniref:LppA family lipoprotein n=1 Tax=Amycolatopsis keratiniphila TaxID=129921 RepID=UPI0009F8FD9D|nr:LppA family lipoprotein [Amycolatopsis keratiniphila]